MHMVLVQRFFFFFNFVFGGMIGRWRFDRLEHRMAMLVMVSLLLHQNLSFCWYLNNEALALLKFRDGVVNDPFGALAKWNSVGAENGVCSWFGVECSGGKVVALNLKDLHLEGTLAPGLGRLVHIKSIILRNNSFSGNIPMEIGELKELEILDLGYNNFTGSFPFSLSNNPSLTTLLLDNNRLLDSISYQGYEPKVHPEFQRDEKQLIDASTECHGSRSNIRSTPEPENVAYRRLLQFPNFLKPSRGKLVKGNQRGGIPKLRNPFAASVLPSDPPLSPSPFSNSPSPSPSESLVSSPSKSPFSSFLTPSPSPLLKPITDSPRAAKPPVAIPEPAHSISSPSPALTPKSSKKEHHLMLILAGSLSGALFILFSAIGIVFFRNSKVVTVRPWATGLSGQLQRAFVTGVPKLNRPEIVAACEDFSNIIGSFSDGTVYKGTLSSGVEIAVTSTAARSREDWSKFSEEQFRKKIEELSKVNHKNFVNLIGFCEEEEPFTRTMVFEYAPNGTLFEHLHIQEAEHLDWGMRLRIAMGMAYCLEHMHQLTPPIAHKDLHSSCVYLTEDYATKISDFRFWNEVTAAKMQSASKELLEFPPPDLESNVYSFGVILFEIITGRIPYSSDNCSLADWASDYLKSAHSLKEMVDPTLKSFKEEELENLFQVIKECVHPDPKQRPPMVEITSRLKAITTMGPDGATPKLSPLWWAELEIMSLDES